MSDRNDPLSGGIELVAPWSIPVSYDPLDSGNKQMVRTGKPIGGRSVTIGGRSRTMGSGGVPIGGSGEHQNCVSFSLS